MDAEVEKLAENLQIKKKAPKNWSDLPLEMKEEVVKYVDFKSSLRLRQTARLERSLVDSRKSNFSTVEIGSAVEGGFLEIWRRENEVERLVFRDYKAWDMQNMASFVAHVLKTGNIDELKIMISANLMEEVLKKIDSVRIKKLTTGPMIPLNSTALLLSKCPEMLDSVYILHYYNPPHEEEYKVADLAKIKNTKTLEYINYYGSLDRNQLSEFVKAFANRQNTLGTTVKLCMILGHAILNFLPILREIQSGDRIPTSDPSIEILFQVVDANSYIIQYVHMHFVPSESKINNSEI